MRSKIVKVANKEIFVQEKTIKELKELSQKISVDMKTFLNVEVEGKQSNDMLNEVIDLVQDKLLIVFPSLNQDDIDNAYMSELEELIKSFLEINFMWAKKIGSQLMKFQ